MLRFKCLLFQFSSTKWAMIDSTCFLEKGDVHVSNDIVIRLRALRNISFLRFSGGCVRQSPTVEGYFQMKVRIEESDD